MWILLCCCQRLIIHIYRSLICGVAQIFRLVSSRINQSFLFHRRTEIDLSGTGITNENLGYVWQETCKYQVLQELRFMDCDNISDEFVNGCKSSSSLSQMQLSHHLSPGTVLELAKYAWPRWSSVLPTTPAHINLLD